MFGSRNMCGAPELRGPKENFRIDICMRCLMLKYSLLLLSISNIGIAYSLHVDCLLMAHRLPIDCLLTAYAHAMGRAPCLNAVGPLSLSPRGPSVVALQPCGPCTIGPGGPGIRWGLEIWWAREYGRARGQCWAREYGGVRE